LGEEHIRDRLSVLQLEHKDVYALFDLLDEANEGKIPNEKFFRGCARLHGEAMSCDLNHLHVDFGRYTRWCADLTMQQKELNHRLHDLVADIDCMDRDIVKSEHDARDPVLAARRHRHRDARHLDDLAKMSQASSEQSKKKLEKADDSEESEMYDPAGELQAVPEERAGSKLSKASKRSSLVMASIQNLETFDEMVEITNHVREDHHIERHTTHREEYDKSLEDFYESHPTQARKNEESLQQANLMIGNGDDNPKIRQRHAQIGR
jgi:hypothetical protein